MDRRSEKLTPAAIEVREDRYAAEWPRFWLFSGIWGPGVWKHPAAWCLSIAVHFRLPVWSVKDNALVVTSDWRPATHVEWREHWVFAKRREAAIAALVRDLRQDERAEFISGVAIYRVGPPLDKTTIQKINQVNAGLNCRREALKAQLFPELARTAAHRQQQLCFA